MEITVLKNKHIVLGITGGIAAYKSAMLTSKLVQAGAIVDVVMTDAAQKFITPLTFQALTHRRIYTNLFQLPAHENIPHIDLADKTDLVIIAPATANTLAKIANGLADNLLTTIALATPAPILIAPAMETDMWQHPATQENITRLRNWGLEIVGPAKGRLASGAMGEGRMVEPHQILDAARYVFAQAGDMVGKKVVVTAGGTREALDPVRYITNRSSGKMGYAIAEVAHDRGADVILISTATHPHLAKIKHIAVNSAAEMKTAVLSHIQHADALVMAAAVADYRPLSVAEQKIKKSDDDMTLSLARTDDILKAVFEQRQSTNYPHYVVGFAAETQNLLDNAAKKLKRKGLDLIVANDVSRSDAGFAVDTNEVTLLSASGNIEKLPLMTKTNVAEFIWNKVVEQDF